jgi:hypothetical protein
VLSGFAAMGVSAAAAIIGRSSPALANAPTVDKSWLIDVHHHFAPPSYVAENRARVSPAALDWTPQKALDAMDAQGVATAVLSLALPGVWFGDAEGARRTSRACNDYAANLALKHPGRFGLFPVIPLPDTEGSLREIEYSFDVLKGDGVGVLTSYTDDSGSKWLGNPAFAPVFEELNRRKAVVFVHPTVANCCQKLLPDVSPLVSEIPEDTTRAVTNLMFTGSLARFRILASSSRTAAATCRWSWDACTIMRPRTSPKWRRMASTTNSRGFSTILPAPRTGQRSRLSPRSFPRRRSFSAATIRLCRSRKQRRA